MAVIFQMIFSLAPSKILLFISGGFLAYVDFKKRRVPLFVLLLFLFLCFSIGVRSGLISSFLFTSLIYKILLSIIPLSGWLFLYAKENYPWGDILFLLGLSFILNFQAFFVILVLASGVAALYALITKIKTIPMLTCLFIAYTLYYALSIR